MDQSVPRITNSLASLAVADLTAASRWYEALLGPGANSLPEVLEWRFPGGGGLQVYVGPERAGHGSCTMLVRELDEMTTFLRQSGVAPNAVPMRIEQVDTAMIKDPDGNSIAFVAASDGTS